MIGIKTMSESTISFLNVGTRILTKDVMDQYIRSLGDHNTHYAASIKSALRILKEKWIDVLILEYELSDGTAYSLLRNLKTKSQYDHLYFVFGMEESDTNLKNLASELDVDNFLVKPFSGNDLTTLVKKYNSRFEDDTRPEVIIRRAEDAFRERAYRLADRLYLELETSSFKDAFVHYKIGSHYLRKPDFDKALDFFGRAIEANPEFVPALSAAGMVHLKKKKHALALKLLQKAHQLSPLNPDRARVIAKLRIDWAVHDLKSASHHDPHNNFLHYELAKTLIMTRNYVKGLDELKKMKIDENHKFFSEVQALTDYARRLSGLQ